MMRPLTALAIALVTLLSVLTLQGVEGIWCFQCNSVVDGECFDLTVNSTKSPLYKECQVPDKKLNTTKEDLFCRKIVQKIHDRDGLLRVVRKCGWEKGTKPCYTVSTMGHKDEVCQCFTDACNDATHQKPAATIPFISLCVAMIAMVRH